MALKDKSVEELKKLAASLKSQEEKAPTDLPTPQNPDNYNDNDKDRDEQEFSGPEGLADEPETDDGLPQEVASADKEINQGDAKGDSLSDDDMEEDPRPTLDDESAMEDEADDAGSEFDKKTDIDKDGNPIEASQTAEAPATELTPQEASLAAKPRTPASEQTVSLVPGSHEYLSDLMKRFKAAQDESNLNRNLNNAGKYAYAAATGFRGVQTNPQIVNAMEESGKNADLPIKQFEQQLQVEGQDPNSQASNSMRQALASTLGIDPAKLANMNGDQMQKMSSSMGTIINNKAKAAAAAMNAQTNVQKAQILQQQANIKGQAVQNQLPLINARTDAATAQAKYLGQKPGLEQQKIAAMKDRSAKATTDRQSASDEKEIAKASKELNGLSASSRSVIGSAERIKAGGQRMITILDDPNATPQDMQSAAADMNAMISGNATVSGTDHSSYNNLQTQFAKAVQYITSSPSAPDVPEVKQHMKDVANKIMALSDKIQEKQAGRVFAGRKAVFDRNPDARQAILDSLKDTPDAGAAYDGSTPVPPNATDAQKQARIAFLKAKAAQ